MKISSVSTGGMVSVYGSHQAHKSLFTRLRQALHAFFRKLDQLGTAVALSEAGDLDGAKVLLDKHAK